MENLAYLSISEVESSGLANRARDEEDFKIRELDASDGNAYQGLFGYRIGIFRETVSFG